MNHPDQLSCRSFSPSGSIVNSPQTAILLVVTDEEQNPAGLLEKWTSEAWIYASTDSLVDLN